MGPKNFNIKLPGKILLYFNNNKKSGKNSRVLNIKDEIQLWKGKDLLSNTKIVIFSTISKFAIHSHNFSLVKGDYWVVYIFNSYVQNIRTT